MNQQEKARIKVLNTVLEQHLSIRQAAAVVVKLDSTAVAGVMVATGPGETISPIRLPYCGPPPPCASFALCPCLSERVRTETSCQETQETRA